MSRFAGPLATMVALVFPSAGCGLDDPCANAVISRVKSPDGVKEAIVFERDCGATTRSSTQLSVLGAGSAFLEQPTTWAATQAGNAAVTEGTSSEVGISVNWASSNRLVVIRPAGARSFKAEQVVGGVTLEYRESTKATGSQP